VNADLALLLGTAASIGCVHTLLGPDHYVPFVALARSRGWRLPRTLTVTALCGAGHVAGSLALGALGIAAGWALGSLVALETLRAALAGWLLIGFGLAYTAWGIRLALRRREHQHPHLHADGVVHLHPHDHTGAHAHPHFGRAGHWLGPWTLFVIFALGPCEPLIPLLMVPASRGAWGELVAVTLAFAVATIGTMVSVVTLGALGLGRLGAAPLERWSHALAGAAILLCGAGIRFLGL
jgi:hypothetical protein